MLDFTLAQPEDLPQILQLQFINLPKNISAAEAKEQGFVTVHHNLELLTKMNSPYPHIVAKDKEQVVGYALVMLPALEPHIPVLQPMFKMINSLTYQGRSLQETNYFVMGQVCVDKGYRGQGVFSGMYQAMKKYMSPHFSCTLTEIATRNTRSIRAHQKVGFETIHIFEDSTEEWAIVAWDFI